MYVREFEREREIEHNLFISQPEKKCSFITHEKTLPVNPHTHIRSHTHSHTITHYFTLPELEAKFIRKRR